MKSVRARIRGRVQGVGYRASTAAEVERRGGEVRGYVRNLPDGSVEAVFAGPSDAVDAMLEWCRSGPPMARVDAVEVDDLGSQQGVVFTGFTVKI
ncbi:MAG TPA: acylphosphatase [Bdellovibrionota bacterium]|nr:acylphosphatase [Bdellovibrionota bacterium]